MSDDDLLRRVLGGGPEPADAASALSGLRPAMRRARARRRIAVGVVATAVLGSGAAMALSVADGPQAPTVQTAASVDRERLDPVGTAPTSTPASTTAGAESGVPLDASAGEPATSIDAGTPVPPPTIETVDTEAVPAPTPTRVDRAPLPAPAPSPTTTMAPAAPPPSTAPTPTTTVSVGTTTTIASTCGQVVVRIRDDAVAIESISPLPGFDAEVATDGPESIELVLAGGGGTCEIHAELERGELRVEVQDSERDA